MAMRLVEKGYRVRVLERGKRLADDDFPQRNWNVFKYLWLPVLRCFGIQQIDLLGNLMVLRGSGVGGGSLVYANVLMEPGAALFEAAAWRHLADWRARLRPHYATARRMLGVAPNPRRWPADDVLQAVAGEFGLAESQTPTDVAVYFGEAGVSAPDPYFGGEGPERSGCTHCGGCMVGCRFNAKNTLTKNYLYLAEKWGATVTAEAQVDDVRPLAEGGYAVTYRSSTNPLAAKVTVTAKNVVFAAGTIGTLKLLFRLRDITGSLPKLSQRLGENVRTNSEALLGVTSREDAPNYSEGIAITSVVAVDHETMIEPVRYRDGSSFMRLLGLPLVEAGGAGFGVRLGRVLGAILRRPGDFLHHFALARWARQSTILLVMQTRDTLTRVRLGRGLTTLFRRGLVTVPDPEHPIDAEIAIGHAAARKFAARTNAIPQGNLAETLFNMPMTAHILGGVPFGRDAEEGVIGLDFQVHGYPGLYVVDGSVMPGNPGINPTLTIAALAELAASELPPKPGALVRVPLMVE